MSVDTSSFKSSDFAAQTIYDDPHYDGVLEVGNDCRDRC